MVLQLHKVKEAALILDCSPDHVYDLISGGDLSPIDIAAAKSTRPKIRLSGEEIAMFIEKRTSAAKHKSK